MYTPQSCHEASKALTKLYKHKYLTELQKSPRARSRRERDIASRRQARHGCTIRQTGQKNTTARTHARAAAGSHRFLGPQAVRQVPLL